MTETPTLPARLVAAIDVFTDLGWREATLADALERPLGTPEQQRVARDGLATGAWGEFGQIGDSTWGWVPWVDVDTDVLAVFAVRVGVDAKRAARILPSSHVLDDERAARLLAERGARFGAAFVTAACRSNRRPWEHATSAYAGAVVRVVDALDLPVPHEVEYLKDWSVYALGALTGEGELYPQERGWCPPEVVARRALDHLRAGVAVGVPATGPFGSVVPHAVAAGWVDRDEAVRLVLTALDAAQRPGDRRAWVQALTGPLGLTDDELVAHADALVTVLAHGDGPVVEALAPRLLAAWPAGAPDDVLGDVLAVSLPVRAKKVQLAVLAAAAARLRPSSSVVESVAPLVVPRTTATDRRLARAAQQLVTAWDLSAATDEPAVTEVPGDLWRATPPVWEVPRLVVGEATVETVSAAAAALTGRPEGVVDVEVERFLALANALAHADREAARTALGGVRGSSVDGLRCVPAWIAGEASSLVDRPARRAWNGRELVYPPATAREASVVRRLGEAPVLLSTPTWVDLRVDPADLVDRLRAHAAAGAAVSEADLYLALTRTDVSLASDEMLSALDVLDVPVVLQDGSKATFTAGPAARAYLLDPFVEPAVRPGGRWRWWQPVRLAVPASLAAFPARLGDEDRYDMPGPETFPTWGDAAGNGISTHSSGEACAGLVLRQLVRRATPLSPGLAVNVLGSQRSFHPVAAPDGTVAVLEAWERGLLLPGVADVRLLDWDEAPSNLAPLARACGELAAEGLLSVVWPVLDALLGASLRAPRLVAGTAEVAEAVQSLLPAVLAAVAAGAADEDALALPGVRALAARSGSSRAATAARAVVALLPAADGPAVPVEPPARPTRPFDEAWPAGAGTRPAVDDGATLTAQWADPAASTKWLAVDVELPGTPGGPFRVVKSWFYDLEAEGQCAATGAAGRVWLRWEGERVVVSPHRNWRGGTDGPLAGGGPVPPLTTSMVAVVLASLCHDAAEVHHPRELLGSGLVGSASVTVAMRALLPHPDFSPARLTKVVEDPALLPVLWPVLVESVRHAAATPGTVPRWLNRVLDVALVHAPLLREAADRGALPADAASWPGLTDLAARPGSSTVPTKARALVAQLLDDR
ncbi:hypothetical protein F1D97_08680 [Cellulomonas palmilytica]|uniref:DUF7824 domain-containing protein n=1 Tax=Cellulomonas palmilytica TaxID=2608402 RepID=UPI001F159DA0|nr:DUF6493 family protein [Cellulomonas palmilytica]UJP41467.1 hypothetical protein F1D97_08680 [Cellulomonas palmilytica]